MRHPSQGVELAAVLSELGPGVQFPVEPDPTRLVREVVIWVPSDDIPEDPASLVVCTGLGGDLEGIKPLLTPGPSRLVLVADSRANLAELAQLDAGTHDLGLVNVNAGLVVAAAARITQTADEAASRRLASLQRSLSLALADSDPIPALLARLKRVCIATAALIDRHGEILHATGPFPRVLIVDEIASTKADIQALDVDGWRGVACRVADPQSPDEHGGWLVVTSRRPDFPDTYTVSAVQVGASLVEATQRMGVVVRQQERAIRAAVLEQALALRVERHDAELAARVAGLGITFDGEARVVVALLARTPRPGQRRQAAADALLDTLTRIVGAAGVPALVTSRGDGVTMLVQASSATVQRLMTSEQDKLPSLRIGIGRPVSSVGGVVDSYHDAQLAERTLRRMAHGPRLMAYEGFDFATRLFADVGLDRMISWAEDFLRPVAGRENLMAGLRSYFENDQNINIAAEVLSIHHNSLRYRLAKVEELLGISLKQPAAVSSLFLALTALDLTRQPGSEHPRPSRSEEQGLVGDVPASGHGNYFGGGRDEGVGDLGVVISPHR
jgi:DNA-binding PucR family transcriptional regulator